MTAREAEIGVMCLQGNECQRLLEAREGQGRMSYSGSEGTRPCHHLDCGLLASGTMRQHSCVVLSCLGCGTLLRQPEDTGTGPKRIFLLLKLKWSNSNKDV